MVAYPFPFSHPSNPFVRFSKKERNVRKIRNEITTRRLTRKLFEKLRDDEVFEDDLAGFQFGDASRGSRERRSRLKDERGGEEGEEGGRREWPEESMRMASLWGVDVSA